MKAGKAGRKTGRPGGTPVRLVVAPKIVRVQEAKAPLLEALGPYIGVVPPPVRVRMFALGPVLCLRVCGDQALIARPPQKTILLIIAIM